MNVGWMRGWCWYWVKSLFSRQLRRDVFEWATERSLAVRVAVGAHASVSTTAEPFPPPQNKKMMSLHQPLGSNSRCDLGSVRAHYYP